MAALNYVKLKLFHITYKTSNQEVSSHNGRGRGGDGGILIPEDAGPMQGLFVYSSRGVEFRITRLAKPLMFCPTTICPPMISRGPPN